MEIDSKDNFRYRVEARLIAYSVKIISLIRGFPSNDINRILSNQLLRCATSIGANFVEAQAANSRKDFINFLTIALKSANESAYWFKIILAAKIGHAETVIVLYNETIELTKLLGSIVKKLRN